MPRLFPIKKNLKEAIIEAYPNDDKMFQLWANNIQWYKFLDKKPDIWVHDNPFIITVYSESFWLYDGNYGTVTLYLHYHCLKDEFKIYTFPEVELDGEPAIAVPVNPCELPGQRFLENFRDVRLNGGQEDARS